MFGERIAHGMLVSGLISAVLGNQLPGPNSVYLGQDLKFTAPVKIGDTVTVVVTVTEKREDKRIMKLQTTVTNQRGEMVVDGNAVTDETGSIPRPAAGSSRTARLSRRSLLPGAILAPWTQSRRRADGGPACWSPGAVPTSAGGPPWVLAAIDAHLAVSTSIVGGEVVIDDQDELAAGVTLLDLAVRGRGVLPVVPAGDVDPQ